MSHNNFLKFLFTTLILYNEFCTKAESNNTTWRYLSEVEHYDINFVFNITRQLHQMNSFDTFIVYCSHCQEKIASSLEKVLIDKFGVPVIVWGWNNVKRLRHIYLGSKKLVLVNLRGVDDDMLNVVDQTLAGLHQLPIMFFILKRRNYSGVLSYEDLMRFFKRCWRKKFLNVLLTYEVFSGFGSKSQVLTYSYSPFPRLRILNLSNSIEAVNRTVINGFITDVQGYRFRAHLFHNPPTVYLRNTTNANSSSVLKGSIGLSFLAYVHLINATFTAEYFENLNVFNYNEHLQLEAIRHTAQICLNPITQMQPNSNSTATTFPIAMTNYCIIVPVVPEIPASEYLALSRSLHKWHQLSILWFLLLILKYLNRHGWQFSDTFRHMCSVLFNQSLTNPDFQRQRWSYKFLYLAAILWAVVFYSAQNAYMASILSTRIIGKQIYTVDDFLASDLKILAVDFLRKVFFEPNRLPSELISRLVYTDQKNLLKHLESLNTSYAYVVEGLRWMYLEKQQRRLKQPLFRVASKELCTVDQFVQVPIQWDSPFEGSMYRFFLNSQETGLQQKWLFQSHQDGIKDGLLKILEDKSDDFKPLPLEFYTLPLQLYFLMIVICFICLLLELSLKRLKERKTQQ